MSIDGRQLSTGDIEELLEVGHQGSADEAPTVEKPVRTHDLLQFNRLTREQMSALTQTHEQICQDLTRALSGRLDWPVTVGLKAVTQQSYGDVVRGRSPREVLVVLAAHAGEPGSSPHRAGMPGQGRGLLWLTRALSATCIERLLGGSSPAADRALSELDKTVLLSAVSTVIGTVSEAWGALGAATYRAENVIDLETAQQLLRLWQEMVTVETSWEGEELSGTVGLTVPLQGLEPALAATPSQGQVGAQGSESVDRTVLMELLQQIPVTVSVRLGHAQLSLREVMDLKPGDVILLDLAPGDPAELRINKGCRFVGTTTTVRNRYALQLTGKKGTSDV